MVRIIAGDARGRVVKTEPGRELRPTLDRVKEGMFSAMGPLVPGARVLDLFAGCGNLGLEALSRGAQHVVFVEVKPGRCRLVRENLETLGYSDRAHVIQADAVRYLGEGGGRNFDLVLADPPYGAGFVRRVVERLALGDVVGSGGMICIQHSPDELPPEQVEGLEFYRRGCYGDTVVTFFIRERGEK